ncbi:MAG: hypothetical protein HC872_09220 [Gammaproteobacteria bacterium]|nr:hypothetical protein [Gammaproteobacteria bacterium]
MDYPAGSWILPAQAGLGTALQEIASDLALNFVSVTAATDVPRHAAKAPRLGVWVPWADTDSIGWLRHTLDQRRIPYQYVRDEDIRAGGLRGKYDVLLYGHVDLELAEQIHGIPKAWGPMPYRKTSQSVNGGNTIAFSYDNDDLLTAAGGDDADTRCAEWPPHRHHARRDQRTA